MKIGKLRITWGKKAKDFDFIGIPFSSEKFEQNQKLLKKRVIEDKFEIIDHYRNEEGVMFFLAKF